ncbi:MAG TPA: hypothetical protein P5081_11295 [Phycisphaerae bacterium]|nr:hypothetical protein [Phycisphaerae bacterium]HRW53465.1 hypothetical protein [Phycisphaerae bacterium]
MRRFETIGFGLMLAAILTVAPAMAPSDSEKKEAPAIEPKIVQVHEGRHWIWCVREDHFKAHQKDYEALYEYADQAFDHLCACWGITPERTKYYLLAWPKTGGGFAVGDIGELKHLPGDNHPGIGISYDLFYETDQGVKGWWAVAIITHEMTNLVLGQTVSGGWPVDWWANHISPFPKMTAVQIELSLRPDVGVGHARQLQSPQDRMFAELKDQFGWSLFRRAFEAAREDGINWDRIGENPSALRTNYVCAYLQLSAPEDLRKRLEGVVPNYDAKVVEAILSARRRWKSMEATDGARLERRERFLRGHYE